MLGLGLGSGLSPALTLTRGDAARGAALEAALRVREQRRSTLRLPAVRALHRAEEAGAKEVLLAALERERRRGAAERLVRAAHEPASQEAVGHGVEGRLLVGRQRAAVDGARALRAAQLEP